MSGCGWIIRVVQGLIGEGGVDQCQSMAAAVSVASLAASFMTTGGLSGHICVRWSPALVGDCGTAVAGESGHHPHSRHIGRRERSAG